MVTNLSDLSPFAEACGLKTLVDLRVVRADGVVLAEGELDLPCALVGRDHACEVTLVDPEVSLKHACVQAVGGRVLVADLGSRTGLAVPGQSGPALHGWLSPTEAVSIGTFRLMLRRPLLTRPSVPATSPLLPNPEVVAAYPRVGIRFLNGRSVNSEWVVNRVVTFVGRARDCKISLAAEDIAPYHCYFLHTPQGLFVVDLLSDAGISVNGEPVRFAPLKSGDRLQVGRFRLGFQYLDQPRSTVLPNLLAASFNGPPSAPLPAAPPSRLAADAPKLFPGPVAGRLNSPPITLVPAPAAPAASPAPLVPPGDSLTPPDFAALAPPRPAPAEPDPTVTPKVAQFTQAQNQMLEQFQQSMIQVFQMFGDLHREQVATMQAELARMAELNAEMQRLQSQLAPPGPPPSASPALPEPDAAPAVSEATAAQHNWVYERMTALQSERQTLWSRLYHLMVPKPGAAPHAGNGAR